LPVDDGARKRQWVVEESNLAPPPHALLATVLQTAVRNTTLDLRWHEWESNPQVTKV
jgi:hypothetical protein